MGPDAQNLHLRQVQEALLDEEGAPSPQVGVLGGRGQGAQVEEGVQAAHRPPRVKEEARVPRWHAKSREVANVFSCQEAARAQAPAGPPPQRPALVHKMWYGAA